MKLENHSRQLAARFLKDETTICITLQTIRIGRVWMRLAILTPISAHLLHKAQNGISTSLPIWEVMYRIIVWR